MPVCKPNSVYPANCGTRQPSIWIQRYRGIRATYPSTGQPKRTLRGPRSSGDGTPTWSCSGWGLPGQPVTRLPVRSYRTISTLPRRIGAVCFLLHFPSPFDARTLSGTLPCGVRTFLPCRSKGGCPTDMRPAVSVLFRSQSLRRRECVHNARR
jgi:hypothetical protein